MWLKLSAALPPKAMYRLVGQRQNVGQHERSLSTVAFRIAPHLGSETERDRRERAIVETVFRLEHYKWGSQTEGDYRERAIIQGASVDHLLWWASFVP